MENVTEVAGSVPIGTPIENSTAYVLDEHLALARPFEAGELYVGGDGVASGYVNAPDLTNERFLPDPFSSEIRRACAEFFRFELFEPVQRIARAAVILWFRGERIPTEAELRRELALSR